MFRTCAKPGRIMVAPRICMRYKSKTKIPIQLHQDVAGLGLRGEVVRVLPGRMRNQLHPNNGASYVLAGKPLRFPLVTRQQAAAVEEKRRAALAASEAPVEEKVTEEEIDYSELGFLQFPTAKSQTAEEEDAASSVDLYSLHNALESLPKVLTIKLDVLETGFLASNYSADEFAKFVSNLIGFPIHKSTVSFQILTGHKKAVKSWVLDHYGIYDVTFNLSSADQVQRQISIIASNENVDIQHERPFDVPIPGQTEATGGDANISETSETPDESQKDDSNQAFPWENNFITELERRVRK